MEFLSLAKQRCSVRKYKTDEIEKLYFKEFEIQCFCVSIGDSRSMRKIVI